METTVVKLAAELCGADEDSVLLQALCDAAVEFWRRRLKGAPAEESGKRHTAVRRGLHRSGGLSGEELRRGGVLHSGRCDGQGCVRPIRNGAGRRAAAVGGAADGAVCGFRGFLLQRSTGMSAMQELLRRYGQSATLKNPAGEKMIRAFLQPEKAREEGVPGTVTPIGWVDDRLWSYIGLEAVEPGDVIVQGGVSYRVRSSRAYWLGDAVHHWWALLEREREAAK